MFARILVPLDGTPRAELALLYAVALAQHGGGRLVLLRVVHITPPAAHHASELAHAATHEAEAYLSGQIQRLASQGIPAESAVPCGELTDWIIRVATSHHADLIVMTARTLESWVGGSAARGVIERTTVPVLLVPETAEPAVLGQSTRLVVPLDGTPFAEEAVPLAARLARQIGGELVLLRAVPSLDHTQTRTAARYLDHLIGQSALQGQLVRSTVRAGTPSAAIAKLARELGTTVLVMATHLPDDRTSIDRLREGSVTEAVFRHSGVPLLLIRSHLPPASPIQRQTPVGFAADLLPAYPALGVVVKEVAPPGGGFLSSGW